MEPVLNLPFDTIAHALTFASVIDAQSLAMSCTHFAAALYSPEAVDLWDKLVVNEAGGPEVWNTVFAPLLTKGNLADAVRSAHLRSLYCAVRNFRSFIQVIPGEDSMSTTGPMDAPVEYEAHFAELGFRSAMNEFPASNVIRRATDAASAINLRDICRRVADGAHKSICTLAQPLEHCGSGQVLSGNPLELSLPKGYLLKAALGILLELSGETCESDPKGRSGTGGQDPAPVLAFSGIERHNVNPTAIFRDVTKWRDLNSEDAINEVKTTTKQRPGGRGFYVPDCTSVPIVDYQSGIEALSSVLISRQPMIQELMFEFRHVASGGTLRLFELAGYRSLYDRVYRPPNLKFLLSSLSETARRQRVHLKALPALVQLMLGPAKAGHAFITTVHEDMTPDCWEEYLVGFAKWLPTVGLTSLSPGELKRNKAIGYSTVVPVVARTANETKEVTGRGASVGDRLPQERTERASALTVRESDGNNSPSRRSPQAGGCFGRTPHEPGDSQCRGFYCRGK